VLREVNKLIDAKALVVEGSDLDRTERNYLEGWEWGPMPGLLHFGLEDNPAMSLEASVALQKKRAKHDPSPPLFQTVESAPECLTLPIPSEVGALIALMARRRTIRFAGAPSISLQALSDCLLSGMGITGEVQTEIGRLPLSMTPSGGARNPYEAFVYARNVEGLPGGFYRYAAYDHALVPLHSGLSPLPSSLLAGQSWADAMPCVIFLVAHFERTMWKYVDCNGYRVVLIEAGHIAQNMMLTATAHGLSACPTAALSHSAVKNCLKLERITHSPLYALTLSVRGEDDAQTIPATTAKFLN
jgi:SagB-type dehydrogenase family enzyme